MDVRDNGLDLISSELESGKYCTSLLAKAIGYPLGGGTVLQGPPW